MIFVHRRCYMSISSRIALEKLLIHLNKSQNQFNKKGIIQQVLLLKARADQNLFPRVILRMETASLFNGKYRGQIFQLSNTTCLLLQLSKVSRGSIRKPTHIPVPPESPLTLLDGQNVLLLITFLKICQFVVQLLLLVEVSIKKPILRSFPHLVLLFHLLVMQVTVIKRK